MTYSEWEDSIPESLRLDPVWKVKAYRLGLFLADLSWADATKLYRDGRTRSLADQLYRAVGSISANVCEGFSRGTGSDRARFFEYALGSARESRDWYYKSRHVLTDDVANHRMELSSEIVALLVAMIRTERRRGRLKEQDPEPRLE